MTKKAAHDQKIIEQFTRWAKPFSDLAVHAEEDGMHRTLAAAQIGSDMQVLDVACGPGIVACAVASQARHVTGIDLTPAMIAQAKARQDRLGLTNVAWRIGDATQLPFADDSFDVVLTRYSFHHMKEPIAALREIKRVARRRVVVIDATPTADTQTAYDRMETLRDPSHTSALTVEQLRAIGDEASLMEQAFDSYRLEVKLDTLADAGDMAALTAMFEEDIRSGKNRIGVNACAKADGIYFTFPISIIAWSLRG
ncbi:MAG TPA: methyltransferase domain-containing protein [Rhizomicrobium sp.]